MKCGSAGSEWSCYDSGSSNGKNASVCTSGSSETLEYMEQALKIGFSGVMYDGSTLSYDET